MTDQHSAPASRPPVVATGGATSPVFARILRIGVVSCLTLGAVAIVVGYLIGGAPAAWGAAVGAALSFVLVNLTPVSIIVANRFAASAGYLQIFFGVVLGVWLLKLVILIAALVVLRGQPWLDGIALFAALAGGLLAGLVVDSIVVLRSRITVGDRAS